MTRPLRKVRLTDVQVAAIRATPEHYGRVTLLAKEYGVDRSTICRLLNDPTRRSNATTSRGERNPKAKLTNEQVAIIRSIPFSRGVIKQLAGRFGVSCQTITDVRNGLRYQTTDARTDRLMAAARAAQDAHEAGKPWADVARAVVEIYASKAWSKVAP